MHERIEAELAVIRQRFPDVEYVGEGCWFRVPSYPLPEGWKPVRDGSSLPDSHGIPRAASLRVLRSFGHPVPGQQAKQLHRTG